MLNEVNVEYYVLLELKKWVMLIPMYLAQQSSIALLVVLGSVQLKGSLRMTGLKKS